MLQSTSNTVNNLENKVFNLEARLSAVEHRDTAPDGSTEGQIAHSFGPPTPYEGRNASNPGNKFAENSVNQIFDLCLVTQNMKFLEPTL